MLDLKENIGYYYNKVDPANIINSETAFNNIAKYICFELLDSCLNIQDIDKIMAKILQKSNRVKLKDYITYKKGQPKCILCGTKSNIKMRHIKPKASRPDLEYDINNIAFLCDKCHGIIHGSFENARVVNKDVRNRIQQIFKEKLNERLGNELLVKLANK